MGYAATIGFCLSALSLIGIVFCIISNEWKTSSAIASQQSLKNIRASEGLWMRCTVPTPGNLQCDNYDTTLFDVPVFLQILRALMMLAAILMLFACVMDCLAMDCVNGLEPRMKVWMARIAGILAIVAGVFVIGSVSWYAAEVVREFNLVFTNNEIKYTFGAALYVGWITGGIGLISGSITLCCSCFSDDEDDYIPAYKPKKAARTSEEYV